MTRCGVVGRRIAGLVVLTVSMFAGMSGVASADAFIEINAPEPGATYYVGQPVTIDYSCTSDNPQYPVTQCSVSQIGKGVLVPGTPLDTSTPGTFFVGVAYGNGEPPFGGGGVFKYSYEIVADTTPPVVTLTTPANGGRYSVFRTLFRPVRVSFSCSDAQSGIASCTGTQPNGSRLRTSIRDLGTRTFVVTARDNAGNVTTVTHTYRVTWF